MSCNHQTKCPDCGDTLIHQENRGVNESSSAFGQHLHEKYPNTFWFLDIDGIIYKKATKILRVIERKKEGGSLRPSQAAMLPLLSVAINILVRVGRLNQQSGVFLIKSDPPFESAIIQEIRPYCFRGLEMGEEKKMEKAIFDLFKTGEEL